MLGVSKLRSWAARPPSRRRVVYFALALGTVAALAIAVTARVEGQGQNAEWSMIGHDVNNTRSQPFQSPISRRFSLRVAPNQRNVGRLEPRWILTTAGDVSATPAVVDDNRGGVVYFPDWGGKLWKVDAETGKVLWLRSISEYNGIPGSLSRTSPVVTGGMVYVGDLNGNMMAVSAATGDLRWITRIDANPAAIVTTSPIVLGNRLYIGPSSNESAYANTHPGYVCCKFRGSMLALDTNTGQIVWQSFVLPDNGGQPGGFAGGAFVNPAAIDLKNGLVYGGAGNLYSEPASVTACLTAAPGGWSEACFPRDAYFNSVVAFDLGTGEPRWSFRGSGLDAWQLACGNQPASVTWCAAAATGPATTNRFSVWDFAGSGANVYSARISGRLRNVVGIGQKTGIYRALDAGTGEFLWSTLVGPGSDPGGIQWGTAYDGERIYAAIGHNTGQAYRLPSGQVITGGSWAALDPSTGRILWQTPDPQGAPDLAALTVVNGVLYGGSLARTGDQMYAMDAATGEILWRFASGGSVVDGPAVFRGTVYWGSGYARTGGVGNNKFYAFSIDRR